MVATVDTSILTEDMLKRFWERAPGYDAENRFVSEDFEDLRDAGYLKIALPTEFGGLGMSLADVMLQQRRLAYYAAPTALAVNMHLYWTGVFADVWRSGDTSVETFLREAGAGEVFAAGHAESGNDLPVLLSTTRAERADGGYRFFGRKSFGSLTPVWTRMGLHAMDSSDAANPKIIHAFMPRDTQGISIHEVWDTLGMRGTKSEDTQLDGAFVPDSHIARVLPAGAAGFDYFVLCIFAWVELGFSNVYYGLAQRVLDMTVEAVKNKTSIALSRSMAYHAEIQHELAEMSIAFETIGPLLDRLADDWSNGVDHGHMWGLKLVAAKHHATNAAWTVVDKALDVNGGFAIFKRSGLERLWRDARLGRIHPANSGLVHEFVAKTLLGINPDEQPRWG